MQTGLIDKQTGLLVNIIIAPENYIPVDEFYKIIAESLMIGDKYRVNDDGSFEKLQKSDDEILAELKTYKMNKSSVVNNTYASLMRELTAGQTSEERDTWPIQLQIAKQIVAGVTLDAEDWALVDAILKPGESAENWAAKVVGKNSGIKMLIGTANGLLRITLDAINNATTTDEIDAILKNAQQKANAAPVAFLQG